MEEKVIIANVPTKWLEGLLDRLKNYEATLEPIDTLSTEQLKSRVQFAMLQGYIKSADHIIKIAKDSNNGTRTE